MSVKYPNSYGGYTFSDFFVIDEDSPEYSACVAILLYRDWRRYITFAEDIAIDYCNRGNGVIIPKGHTPPAGTGHCKEPIYRYIGFPEKDNLVSKDNLSSVKKWIDNMCKAVISDGMPDPIKAQNIMIAYWNIHSHELPPSILRNSTK